jgi:predicted RNase H-like nuclease (RuvC/YqgF family)
MRLEANLRENQLAARPLDEQFVAYETDMMKHDLDRARVEQEKKDLQRRAEQEAERGEIELLRDRTKAEHAWEIERLDLQAKAVAHALEKMSSTSQPIERLTIMQSPGDVGALPNSPMYLLSQAALVIRELFSLVGDRK